MMGTRLESSSLPYAAYRAELKVLQVEFVSTEIYRYFGVPQTIYLGLLEADSKGRYFNRHIRNQFPYERVLPDKN